MDCACIARANIPLPRHSEQPAPSVVEESEASRRASPACFLSTGECDVNLEFAFMAGRSPTTGPLGQSPPFTPVASLLSFSRIDGTFH
jgi:hypothetical protein